MLATTPFIVTPFGVKNPGYFTTLNTQNLTVGNNQLDNKDITCRNLFVGNIFSTGVFNSSGSFVLSGNPLNIGTTGTNQINIGNSNSAIVFATGIFLPTSQGTGSNLNYYEEYASTLTFTGAIFTNAPTIPYNIVKIGKLCTLVGGPIDQAGSNVASAMTSVGSIPSRFAPTTNTSETVAGINNNLAVSAVLLVSATGSIVIYNNAINANFTGSGLISVGGSTGTSWDSSWICLT